MTVGSIEIQLVTSAKLSLDHHVFASSAFVSIACDISAVLDVTSTVSQRPVDHPRACVRLQQTCLLLRSAFKLAAGACEITTCSPCRGAREVTNTRKYDHHLTHAMHHVLHWLDIADKIKFLAAVVVYLCLHGMAPASVAGAASQHCSEQC